MTGTGPAGREYLRETEMDALKSSSGSGSNSNLNSKKGRGAAVTEREMGTEQLVGEGDVHDRDSDYIHNQDSDYIHNQDSDNIDSSVASLPSSESSASDDASRFRTYKRRWFGLAQLTLLNIIVSWDWLTFAPVSSTSATYFSVSISSVNWLSTAFLFAFAVASPVVIHVLNRGGPQRAMLVASALILVGNWVRYAGTRRTSFGTVMLGQVIIGLAQPFVLAAPTRYSEVWFGEGGRIAATALPSLANPFGGALGQLIDPFWATKPSDTPSLVLYVAIISTMAALPSPFLPSAPPTPPSHSSSLPKPRLTLSTIRALFNTPAFYLLALPFSIYVASFNALSSLLNQILLPYDFSETAAGITGALLILVGLVTSAIASPFLDRSPNLRIPALRLIVPVIAAMYVAFIFAPQTRTLLVPYIISSLLVDVTFPISPEISSTVVWALGQLLGALFILVMDGLQGAQGEPEGSMKRALVFLAVWACIAVPFALVFGLWGTGTSKRLQQEAAAGGRGSVDGDGGFNTHGEVVQHGDWQGEDDDDDDDHVRRQRGSLL